MKQFALENPIGVRMARPINFDGDYTEYKVIGVVKNFHFESLRDNIGPLAMFIGNNRGSISFRVNTASMDKVIDLIGEKWNEFAPGQPFNYSFLDERFNNMYNSERQLSEIFGLFAMLAISIGCLGLFSLSAFTAEQKTKEIGIRKVLGSSVANIVLLLSKEFIKLIVIAFIIAVPIAFYFMSSWLTEFEYRIDLGFGVFLLAGAISLSIAVITISYHALKAANANPVESLRNE